MRKDAAKCRNKTDRVNLGLAISGALLPPGQYRTTTEIAAFCDCTKQMIHAIEKKAIRKIREAFNGQSPTKTNEPE